MYGTVFGAVVKNLVVKFLCIVKKKLATLSFCRYKGVRTTPTNGESTHKD